MKTLSAIIASISIAFATPAFADGDAHEHHAEHKEEAKNTVKLEMKFLGADKFDVYSVKLTDIKTGKQITENDLETRHTKKLHLLLIDPSFSDYMHLHPTINKNGEWEVAFLASKKPYSYRVFADITRADTGKQEFVKTDIGDDFTVYKRIIEIQMSSTVGEYKFDLALDGELKAGKATMASIKVTKNGKPFNQLEPVMGAFAHVVGFNEDYKTIMHIHPMGKEPESDAERGGDTLKFHIEPEKSGFTKLFAQFKIDGKDVFVPFGVMVK